MTSLREQFLSRQANTREIKVKGWDFPIRVQEMTVGRRLAFFAILTENAVAVNNHEKDPEKYPFVKTIDEAMLAVIFSLVDKDNNLVLKPDDVHEMGHFPYKVIEAIYREAMSLSNLSGQLEEIETEKKD